MIRQAVLFQAKSGMAAEYQRRHDQIWPDLKRLAADDRRWRFDKVWKQVV